MRWTLLIGLLLAGCGGWFEDQAGTVSGPAVVVHCDNQTRARLTPGTVGDSTTRVHCPNTNEAPELVQGYEETRQ